MEWMKTGELFTLSETLASALLEQTTYPWEALSKIGDFLQDLGPRLPRVEYEEILPQVWVARTASVAATATIIGPVIIGPDTQVRPGAYLRGNVLVGAEAVVGNSTECKNVILFNCVQVPHYNYVGDSILGFRSHMGAGSITSNVKSENSLVVIHTGEQDFPTGRKKVGAMLGDAVEIGCNSVLNPGTVIGPHSTVYPLSMVRGVILPYQIYKKQGDIVQKQDD